MVMQQYLHFSNLYRMIWDSVHHNYARKKRVYSDTHTAHEEYRRENDFYCEMSR